MSPQRLGLEGCCGKEVSLLFFLPGTCDCVYTVLIRLSCDSDCLQASVLTFRYPISMTMTCMMSLFQWSTTQRLAGTSRVMGHLNQGATCRSMYKSTQVSRTQRLTLFQQLLHAKWMYRKAGYNIVTHHSDLHVHQAYQPPRSDCVISQRCQIPETNKYPYVCFTPL